MPPLSTPRDSRDKPVTFKPNCGMRDGLVLIVAGSAPIDEVILTMRNAQRTIADGSFIGNEFANTVWQNTLKGECSTIT